MPKKWFAVVVGSRDYYLTYSRTELVSAENSELASKAVSEKKAWHEEIAEIIECGKTKPKLAVKNEMR